jgi:hypothetical protein
MCNPPKAYFPDWKSPPARVSRAFSGMCCGIHTTSGHAVGPSDRGNCRPSRTVRTLSEVAPTRARAQASPAFKRQPPTNTRRPRTRGARPGPCLPHDGGGCLRAADAMQVGGERVRIKVPRAPACGWPFLPHGARPRRPRPLGACRYCRDRGHAQLLYARDNRRRGRGRNV